MVAYSIGKTDHGICILHISHFFICEKEETEKKKEKSTGSGQWRNNEEYEKSWKKKLKVQLKTTWEAAKEEIEKKSQKKIFFEWKQDFLR